MPSVSQAGPSVKTSTVAAVGGGVHPGGNGASEIDVGHEVILQGACLKAPAAACPPGAH